MKLLFIFGPQAVGKMTVGHELEKITDLKLFHNHMTIDLIYPFFEFGHPSFVRLVNLYRNELFKEVANSDRPGMIFTYVWAFDQQSDWDFVQRMCEIFESKGGEVCFVELEADIQERLKRNTTPHRLAHKTLKRNVVQSEQNLRETFKNHRLNSYEGEIKAAQYVKIKTRDKSAVETAELIKRTFNL